jgi:hypothetical protein
LVRGLPKRVLRESPVGHLDRRKPLKKGFFDSGTWASPENNDPERAGTLVMNEFIRIDASPRWNKKDLFQRNNPEKAGTLVRNKYPLEVSSYKHPCPRLFFELIWRNNYESVIH